MAADKRITMLKLIRTKAMSKDKKGIEKKQVYRRFIHSKDTCEKLCDQGLENTARGRRPRPHFQVRGQQVKVFHYMYTDGSTLRR